MALFNYVTKEITLKVVYYGPGLSGKTTNLQQMHATFDPKKTGKLLALSTETDRTLFFDFLPIKLGKINEFTIRFQLYTVPGQVRYNSTKRLVLRGADAVVFVADSQTEMMEQNIESFQNMLENLEANNIDPNDTPCVLQYNKRDLQNIMSPNELNKSLNSKGYKYVLAAAINGTGVQETFQLITTLLLKHIADKHKVEISAEDTVESFTVPTDDIIHMEPSGTGKEPSGTGEEPEITHSPSKAQAAESEPAPEPAPEPVEPEKPAKATEDELKDFELSDGPVEVSSGDEVFELMDKAAAEEDVFELSEEDEVTEESGEEALELDEGDGEFAGADEDILELKEEDMAIEAEEDVLELKEEDVAIEAEEDALELKEEDVAPSPEEEILTPIEETPEPEPAQAETPVETQAAAEAADTPYSAEKISIMFDSLIELSTSLSSTVSAISDELKEIREQQSEILDALKQTDLSDKKPANKKK